jgi:CheY-like chemotaxis protein
MCHVLIIEDDFLVAFDLKMLLEGNGATSVEIADTEAKAITAAAVKPPAVITSDVGLAEGNGPAAVRAIHEQHGFIPVIFITARPETVPRSGLGAPVFGKPFPEDEVAKAFRTVCPRS